MKASRRPEQQQVRPRYLGLEAEDGDVLGFARPFAHVYNQKDGLPQNDVYASAFDAAGYLWIGTQDGAARYDGHEWMVVDMPNRMRSNWVKDMVIDHEDAIWFATNGCGVVRLRNGQWKVFDSPSGLGNVIVRRLYLDLWKGLSRLFAATDAGVYVFRKERWVRLSLSPAPDDSPVNCVLRTRDGSLWFGLDSGVVKISEAGGFLYDDDMANVRVKRLAETVGSDGESRLWAASFGQGLGWLNGDRFEFLSKSNSGLPHDEIDVLQIPIDRRDRHALWIGTHGGGLALLDEGRWTILDTRRGLPNDGVLSINERHDEHGAKTLWVGTYGGGLARFDSGQWATLDDRTGLPSKVVVNLLEAHADDGSPSYWIGTWGKGGGIL